MKKLFSRSWKSSKQPRKQRKYLYNAPLHLRRRFLSVSLSKELRKKLGKRNIPVVKDDEVKIMTGQHKGKIGKITKVNTRKIRVYVDQAYRLKLDGSKSFYPIHPSNLMITNLNLKDKKRKAKLESKLKK
ncbi:MAG: 50S ribosomal protein L24 [Nanoarchaeota archaeon]